MNSNLSNRVAIVRPLDAEGCPLSSASQNVSQAGNAHRSASIEPQLSKCFVLSAFLWSSCTSLSSVSSCSCDFTFFVAHAVALSSLATVISDQPYHSYSHLRGFRFVPRLLRLEPVLFGAVVCLLVVLADRFLSRGGDECGVSSTSLSEESAYSESSIL